MKNEKYQNKYRIPSARLQTWDYRWAGAYFITICTHDRHHYFGEVVEGKMQLSRVGVIADILWHEIKNRAKNVELGEFVVMPNHIHGILILQGDDIGGNDAVVPAHVETLHATSLPTSEPTNEPTSEKNKFMSAISPKPRSIPTLVRSYKSAVTKHANRLGFEFRWQSLYHDHIIRDQQSFETISAYILNNPLKWEKDKFYAQKSKQTEYVRINNRIKSV